MPRLPPKDEAARRAAFTELVASAPAESQWEARARATAAKGQATPHALTHSSRAHQVGGNTNFAIAAARLGLRVTCLGHTGPDVYGSFMESVLADEGVALQQVLGARRAALRADLCLLTAALTRCAVCCVCCQRRALQRRRRCCAGC